MAEIKWIKITTDIFSDEKIMLIEQMPEADTILVIWFKLLCMAGRDNNNGIFLMNNRVPYTDEMFATIFRRPLNTVRLAIATFEAFGMIDIYDDVVTLVNWEKHQNIDGMEKIRAQNRERQRQCRERKKQALLITSKQDNVMSRDSHAIEEDKEKKEEKDKNNILLSDSAEPDHVPDKDVGNIKPAKSKPVKHKYGEYKNVLLTDEELQKLKTEYSDYEERIERLSSYVASTGKSYKSHYATIRNWARKDAEKPGRKEPVPAWMNKKTKFHNFKERDYDFAELEKALVNQDTPKTAGTDEEVRRRADELKKLLS